MLKLLKRNIVKRFISWKTIVLMIVGLGTMFTCYQHVPGRDGIHFSYLILEGPFAVFLSGGFAPKFYLDRIGFTGDHDFIFYGISYY